MCHRLQDLARVRQDAVPRRRQADAPRGAPKELHPELRFEVVYLAAERRLADVQAASRLAHVSFFSDGDEVSELVEAHATEITTRRANARHTETVLVFPAPSVQAARMPIELFPPQDFPALRRAGRTAAATLAHVGSRLRPGLATSEIDAWVRADTARRGGTPSQLGYQPSPSLPPFPAAVCVSVDDVVCHGIPSPERRLRSGSIVNVDVTTEIGGFHGDTSKTFIIGDATPEARHVVDVARRCLEAGIAAVRPGARLGDIGAAIEELARREGCSVVREFGGHGIGRVMHAPPHVPHHGPPNTGPRLKPGMVFTIEPMVNLGRAEVVQQGDGWTVVTRDGSLSAQFEHTILVIDGGAEVLTLLPAA